MRSVNQNLFYLLPRCLYLAAALTYLNVYDYAAELVMQSYDFRRAPLVVLWMLLIGLGLVWGQHSAHRCHPGFVLGTDAVVFGLLVGKVLVDYLVNHFYAYLMIFCACISLMELLLSLIRLLRARRSQPAITLLGPKDGIV